MGKKNRRREIREKTRLTQGPSADEEAVAVDNMEKTYPNWNTYPSHNFPPNVWVLLVKHRFGGLSLARPRSGRAARGRASLVL